MCLRESLIRTEALLMGVGETDDTDSAVEVGSVQNIERQGRQQIAHEPALYVVHNDRLCVCHNLSLLFDVRCSE